MRHAAAQLEQYGKNDRDRTITMAGMHELDAIRNKIKDQFEGLSLVLCSNVKRTRQTLEGIRPFLPASIKEQYDDSLYQASADILWHKIQTTSPAHKYIMLIGHNPAIGNVLNAVDSSVFQSFPTCGIVVLQSNVSKWHEISAYNLVVEKVYDPNM